MASVTAALAPGHALMPGSALLATIPLMLQGLWGAREPVGAGRASASLASRGQWNRWEFIPGKRDRALGDPLGRCWGSPERQQGAL